MTPDLLEDILAFLYVTGDRKKPSSGDGSTCPQCGAALEYDDESGEMRCPECE